jgi:nucleotide-binding universal stress UspA family protein
MKFLVGYNGSKEAKAALELAAAHAAIFKATVIVMTSMEGGTGEKIDEIGKVEYDLKSARQFLEEKGVACETQQLARGLSPGEDIVRFAEENQVDQLFVGVEKKSKTRKMFLGSTAQFVILKSPCPVTTVK